MSLEAIPSEELAAVVTYLEMSSRPSIAEVASALRLNRVDQPETEAYRGLFRTVGAPWLWFSRLAMGDAELAAIIQHPCVELYTVADDGGCELGMLELDFRQEGECELAFVGLVQALAGHGHGRWLLSEAMRLAWRNGVRRVHVHTCTLDHPAALSAYRRIGFMPYKRSVERFPDPRLLGFLPKVCAPQVPLLGTLA